MTGLLKILVYALQFILATSVVMMIYGLAIKGSVSLDLIFNACFLVGAVIICVALVVMFMPSRILFDKLTDHTNFAERYREQRERKREKANEFLFLGVAVIIIAGLIQIIAWLFTG